MATARTLLALAVGLGLGLVGAMTADAMATGAPTSMQATLGQFEQALAGRASATEVLAQWCRARGLATDPVIHAVAVADATRNDGAVPADVRAMLNVGADEPVGYRHVRLTCGDHVLSDARNWYVPALLTPAMNRELASGDRPFGAVIAAFAFSRERLDSHRGALSGCPAPTILTNRALIRARDGEPLALVVECYQPAVLG